MERVNNKLKITEYVSLSQLKKKFKLHLKDIGYSEFKPSFFSQCLIITLVGILEEIISDCLKDVTKHDINGLYIISPLILKNSINELNKYDFCLKYLKKYNTIIKFHDGIFFNIRKVIDSLESKFGSKLMIDSEARNIISYIILSLQYDIIELSLMMVKYSNKRTLNKSVLLLILNYFVPEELSSKIKLKLDSQDVDINNDLENDLENDLDTVEDDNIETDNIEIVEDDIEIEANN